MKGSKQDLASISEINSLLRRKVDSLKMNLSLIQEKANNRIIKLKKIIKELKIENENLQIKLQKEKDKNRKIKNKISLFQAEPQANKSLSFVAKQNDNLKKILDDKELEIEAAKTKINEMHIENENLKLQINQLQSLQTDGEINKQTNSNVLAILENALNTETNNIKLLNEQRNNLFSLVLKLLDLSGEINKTPIPKSTSDLKKEEKNENKVNETSIINLFRKINNIIGFHNDKETETDIMKMEDTICENIKRLYNKTIELDEKLPNSAPSNIGIYNDLLLHQLKGAVDFIMSLSNSKRFDKRTILEKCTDIDGFIQKISNPNDIQNYKNFPPSYPSVFNSSSNNYVRNQLECIFENVSDQDLKTKSPFKEFYTLFECVLTVNSLLFEKNNEIDEHLHNVLALNEKEEADKLRYQKMYHDKILYLSSKISSHLQLNEILSYDNNNQQAQVFLKDNQNKYENSLEENIDILCDQNNLLNDKVKDLEFQNSELKKQFDSNLDVKQLQIKIIDLESELRSQKSRVKRKASRDEKLIQSLKIELEKRNMYQQKNSLLENENKELKEKINKYKSLKNLNINLANKLKEAERKNQIFKLKQKELESSNQRIKRCYEESNLKLAEFKERTEKFERKKNQLKLENEKLNIQMRTDIPQLKEQNNKLEQEYKNLLSEQNQKNFDLKIKNNLLEKQIEDINELKAKCHKEIAHANLEKKNAKLELLDSQNALQQYKTQFNERLEQMKNKHESQIKMYINEFEQCKQILYNFLVDHNNENYNHLNSNESIVSIVNQLIKLYNPKYIKDYQMCTSILSNENEKYKQMKKIYNIQKSKLLINENTTKNNEMKNNECYPLFVKLTKFTNEYEKTQKMLEVQTKEANKLHYEMQKNLNHSKTNEEDVIFYKNLLEKLRKRLASLFLSLNKGKIIPPNDIEALIIAIEEATYISKVKPDNAFMIIEILRTEKQILTNGYIQKVLNNMNRATSLKLSNQLKTENLTNININCLMLPNNIQIHLRSLIYVALFSRRLAVISGNIHLQYVINK